MTSHFHFFDLPLELRNLIYQQLTRSGPLVRYHVHTEGDPSVTKSFKPLLLLVNKQFKQEYEHEIFKWTQLHLNVRLWNDRDDLRFPLVPGYAFVNLRRVAIDVDVSGWEVTKYLLDEKCNFLRLCCFPALQHLKVRFIIEWWNFEAWIERSNMPSGAREICDRIQTFSELCEMSFSKAKVDMSLYIRTGLFECSRSTNWPGLSANQWSYLQGRFLFLKENYLLCRASLGTPGDSDSDIYCGMKLELEDYGHIDRRTLEAVVNNFKKVSHYKLLLRALNRS